MESFASFVFCYYYLFPDHLLPDQYTI